MPSSTLPAARLADALAAAGAAARSVGSLLRRHAGRPSRVGTKQHRVDLVTNLDREAERVIRGRLRRAFPAVGFLGEEHGARGGAGARWIVDPIDGTMNFVHGVPMFAVSIGLEVGGRLAAGVIYDPMREELFTAIRGRGARLNGRRIRVSPTPALSDSLLATGFNAAFRRNHQPYLRWFTILESRSHAVRRMGSTAICLAYVAAGRLDGFYERDLKAWDVAAGLLLVEEAGGRTSKLDGSPAELSDGRLLATNGRIHAAILRVLASR